MAPTVTRRLDPLPWVAVLVAGVTYWLHGFNGYLSRDLGIYAYAGQQVADGVPPYLGVLNRAGPLAHLAPGLGAVLARATDHDDLLGMRVVFLGFAALSVAAVYLLGRDMFRSPLAGAASAAVFLALPGFIDYAAWGPREKTPMVLFLTLALWAAVRRWWLLAGVFISLATLFLQIAMFVLMPAVLVLALVAPGRWRALLMTALGGMIPVAVLAVYFWAYGALRDAVDAFLLINLRYTTTRAMTPELAHELRTLVDGYGRGGLVLLAVGMLVLVVLGVAALSRRARAWEPGLVPCAAVAVGGVCGLVWSVRDFDKWPDLFPLLPVAVLGIGALAHLLSRVVPWEAAVVLTALGATLATTVAMVYSEREQDQTLTLQRHAVRSVMSRLPDDATVLSIHAPQPLVLTGRTNPSVHQMFASGLENYVDDTWPGGLDGYGAWIREQAPTVVAIGEPRRPMWTRMLGDDYVRVGCTVGWKWFLHVSVPEETRREIRLANRELVPAAQERGHCRNAVLEPT